MMTCVQTWRDFLRWEVRTPQDLARAVLDTHAHLFHDDDRRMLSRVGPDGWPRVLRWIRREDLIYYPRDNRPEPGAPNYADPAALVMRRVWTPNAFMAHRSKQ